MKIGFIGLGIMGSRMAANLLKKGNELVVHNRTKAKADSLIAQGAAWADSPAEVAKRVNLIFTMLAKPDAVAETALLGKRSFLDHLVKGSLWIDCSTVNPAFSKLLANESKARGIRFLDAPVAGSTMPAEHGQLLFFVGGDKADVDAARPFLEAMGKTVFHLGGHGMGSAMKMINNIMLNTAMAAFSEALVLGEALGLPKGTMFDTLANSPVVAPFLQLKRRKIESGDFSEEFPLALAHKDLHLAAETAYESGVAMPSVNTVKEIFALAVRSGLGELDFSAVTRLVAKTQ